MARKKDMKKLKGEIIMVRGSKPPLISPTAQKRLIEKAGAYTTAVVITMHLLEHSLITKVEYRAIEKRLSNKYGLSPNSIFKIGEKI